MARSVQRAAEVLEVLARQREEVAADAIASHLGLAKPVIGRVLATLVRQGYAEPRDRGYAAVDGLALHEASLADLKLMIAAQSVLSRLSRHIGLAAGLAFLREDAALCVAACRPAGAPMTLGQRLPLYCSAFGKALLMAMAEGELAWFVHTILFAPRTAATITNPEVLLLEIEASRARGWVIEDRELDPRLLSVAAPIRKGGEIAAIGVSWEDSRLAPVPERIGPLVAETAKALSRDSG